MSAFKLRIVFASLIAATLALMLLDIAIGAVDIPMSDVWKSLTGGNVDPSTSLIVRHIRLIKATVALLCGMALSVSGLQMQTLFRNPLAGPYVLGISSGASLGVAIMLLGSAWLGISSPLGIVTAAWIGAASVLLAISAVSTRIKDIMVLLILGIMLSSAISAIVQMLQYLSHEDALKSFVIWTMGSLGEVTGPQLAILAAAVSAGLLVASHNKTARHPSARRAIRPHHGAEPAPFTHDHHTEHHSACRHSHCFLRPHRLHRSGHAACGPRYHPTGRPSGAASRIRFGRRHCSYRLRSGLQTACPADQLHHSFGGHSGSHLGSIVQQILLRMIRFSNLTISHAPDKRLLAGASANIPAGSLCALIGRNGSGKSTLLRTLAGLSRPESGNILIADTDPYKTSPVKLAQTIAVVTTERIRVANLRCRDVVALGRAPFTNWIGRMRQDDIKWVDHALGLVGMAEFAVSYQA